MSPLHVSVYWEGIDARYLFNGELSPQLTPNITCIYQKEFECLLGHTLVVVLT